MSDWTQVGLTTNKESGVRWFAIVSAICGIVFLSVAVFGIVELNQLKMAIGLAGVCISAILVGRLFKNPDKLTAKQTNRMLNLAGDTLKFMREGLNEQSATEVCNLLLPATDAASVAIYDEGKVLGHSGCDQIWEKYGDPVRIPWAYQRFQYGGLFVIRAENLEDEKFPTELKASIIAPLKVQDNIVGAIKLYYTKHRHIDETQQATAVGFATLLSTQVALSELDAKTELATKMELRALQAQINPHFLFNTINTIASLIRTDPRQARILLREFAIFYRRTLESSQDLITIELELTQTLRYLGFERARFGADKILLTNRIEPGLEQLQVPAFIIQPIVENAVGHGMRGTGEPLHINIDVKRSGKDVIISIADDGVGMESTEGVIKKGNSKGAGIALKNVDDRLKSCFGKGSGLSIESTVDVGTTVFLTLADVDLPDSVDSTVDEQAPKMVQLDEPVEKAEPQDSAGDTETEQVAVEDAQTEEEELGADQIAAMLQEALDDDAEDEEEEGGAL